MRRLGVNARPLNPGYCRSRDHYDAAGERPFDVLFLGEGTQRQTACSQNSRRCWSGATACCVSLAEGWWRSRCWAPAGGHCSRARRSCSICTPTRVAGSRPCTRSMRSTRARLSCPSTRAGSARSSPDVTCSSAPVSRCPSWWTSSWPTRSGSDGCGPTPTSGCAAGCRSRCRRRSSVPRSSRCSGPAPRRRPGRSSGWRPHARTGGV